MDSRRLVAWLAALAATAVLAVGVALAAGSPEPPDLQPLRLKSPGSVAPSTPGHPPTTASPGTAPPSSAKPDRPPAKPGRPPAETPRPVPPPPPGDADDDDGDDGGDDGGDDHGGDDS